MKKNIIKNLGLKKKFLSLGLACALFSAQAQQSDQWSKGEILLDNGAQIEGYLVYAAHVEVVSIKLTDSTQQTYGSKQLQSFYFLDLRTNLIRHFKKSAIPDESREGIVEVVFEGALQVQRCFKSKYRRRTHWSAFNFAPAESYDHYRYQYFVHDGISLHTIEDFLRKMRKTKKTRLKKELDQFLYQNQLDNSIASWLKAILHYNLVMQEPILSNETYAWVDCN